MLLRTGVVFLFFLFFLLSSLYFMVFSILGLHEYILYEEFTVWLGNRQVVPWNTMGSVLSSVSLEPECHWRGDQTTEGEGEHGEGYSHRGQEDFARQRSGRGLGQGSPLPQQPGASIPSRGQVFYWGGVAILSPFPSPSQHEKRASYGDPFGCKESRKGDSGLCLKTCERFSLQSLHHGLGLDG